MRTGIGALVLLLCSALAYAHFFGPAGAIGPMTEFVVTPDTTIPELASALRAQGYVKSAWGLRFALFEEARGRMSAPAATASMR